MKLAKQGVAYVLIGLFQLGIDWLFFVGLTWASTPVEAANVLGRITGALLGFWLNGRLTFKDQTAASGGLSKVHFSKYWIAWILVTTLSTFGIHLIHRYGGLEWTWLLKPIQDFLLAGVGFLISKHWIYK